MMLPGAASSDSLRRVVLDGGRGRIEPVFDERHVAAEYFAQSSGDLCERLFRLAADVAEDDLLPAALLAEFERVFHRPQADVAVAQLGAGLGVDIAADQHGRAAGQLAQALHARDAQQVLFQC